VCVYVTSASAGGGEVQRIRSNASDVSDAELQAFAERVQGEAVPTATGGGGARAALAVTPLPRFALTRSRSTASSSFDDNHHPASSTPTCDTNDNTDDDVGADEQSISGDSTRSMVQRTALLASHLFAEYFRHVTLRSAGAVLMLLEVRVRACDRS
jgi:hypothetical protein